jgi:diguanylate cyclase (GGDEF)-like protein
MRGTLLTARWDERAVLAGLFAAIGLMATAFSVVAPVHAHYGGVDVGVALVAVAAAVVALLLPRRWGAWVVHVGLGIATGLITVLVAARATPQGQVSVAYLLALASLYCAVYLPHRQMLVHVGLMCVLFAVASLNGAGELDVFYVGVRVATVLLIAEVVSRFAARQRQLLAEIQGQAVHDPLTGALNRRGAVDEAEHVRGVVARAGGTTTVSVVDLDGFKGYNDSRGHAAGDRLLVDLVAAWARTLRAGDVLARVGGDEFVVVLPQTDPRSAEVLLDRMRAANPFPWSVGTVVWPPDEDLFAAVDRADELLYAHKLRRRFRLAGPPLEA